MRVETKINSNGSTSETNMRLQRFAVVAQGALQAHSEVLLQLGKFYHVELANLHVRNWVESGRGMRQVLDVEQLHLLNRCGDCRVLAALNLRFRNLVGKRMFKTTRKQARLLKRTLSFALRTSVISRTETVSRRKRSPRARDGACVISRTAYFSSPTATEVAVTKSAAGSASFLMIIPSIGLPF